MTKAKAIEILNIGYDGCVKFRETLRDNPNEFDYLNDLLIALLTAIDALEQNNGWISVKDRLPEPKAVVLAHCTNGYLNSIGEGGADSPLFDRGQRRALINSIQDISAIKAADVQPVKHGKWMRSDDQCWLTCPFCDTDVDVSCGAPFFYVDNDEVSHINFCPNCGARMDGE